MNHTFVEHLYGSHGIDWDFQMPGQSVSGAAGNDCQCGLAVHQRAGHLVHCAVAADGNHNINAVVGRFAGNQGRVPRILRIFYLIVKARCIQIIADVCNDLVLFLGARNGIDYEMDSFLLSHK